MTITRKARPWALAALAALAPACGATPARGDGVVRAGTEFTLAPGESVRVRGAPLTLTFVRVAGDSRCPREVQCVWQGDATVVLRGAEGNRATDHELHTAAGPAEAAVGGHRVRLTALAPGRTTRGVAPGDYRARLRLD
ncbi:hypothetical protein [Actinomadura atramentaria]|uniref:hypothetical protein n=1 Tax=Actinomadura atramentaria TaxID=1990 RepID=UPI000365381E|nr:hypothetical protein [Actinomadura atramentaria]